MEKVKQWGIMAVVVLIVASLLVACGGRSSSSSGKKWSDLSDVEKANAKWAYQVQQGIKGK